MIKVIDGKIENGKIVIKTPLSTKFNNASVKIYVWVKNPLKKPDYFGKGKNIFGDALKYQKKIRNAWK